MMKNTGFAMLILGGLLMLWGAISGIGVVAPGGFGDSHLLPGVVGNTPLMFGALRFLLVGGFTMLTGAVLLGGALLRETLSKIGATPPAQQPAPGEGVRVGMVAVGVLAAAALLMAGYAQRQVVQQNANKAALDAATRVVNDMAIEERGR